MNESEASFEQEPRERRALERYYHDVYDTQLSESSMVVALDNLIERLPFASTQTLEAIKESCLYPTDYDLEVDSRTAKEKLAILPIAHFGPALDMSDTPIDEVKEWYSDAVRGMNLIVRDTHDRDCLKETSKQHMLCGASTVCPVRFLERYLLDGIVMPDFSTLPYIVDSKRAASISIKKAELAVERRIAEPIYVKSYSAAYSAAYLEYFGLIDKL